MMDRQQHLQWCKDRALEYADRNDTTGAYGSFASDMTKHDETKDHPVLPLGMMLLAGGHLNSPDQMRDFIKGFN